jgi:hypothetical protein
MVSEVVSFHDDIVSSAYIILHLYLSFEGSSSSILALVKAGISLVIVSLVVCYMFIHKEKNLSSISVCLCIILF